MLASYMQAGVIFNIKYPWFLFYRDRKNKKKANLSALINLKMGSVKKTVKIWVHMYNLDVGLHPAFLVLASSDCDNLDRQSYACGLSGPDVFSPLCLFYVFLVLSPFQLSWLPSHAALKFKVFN